MVSAGYATEKVYGIWSRSPTTTAESICSAWTRSARSGRGELVFGLGWGPWHFLGGPGLQTLVVSENQDGRLELFATRQDSTVWHAQWQTSPGGAWSPWRLFFTPSDRFHVLGRRAVNADGRLEVFAWPAAARSGTSGKRRRATVGAAGPGWTVPAS